MFAKLLLIIMFVGATACALLVIRQQRIDTFHEISVVHQHLLTHERTLWELRGEIAERCRPSQVRLVMNQLGGQWSPIPSRPGSFHPGAIQLAQTPPTAAPNPVVQPDPAIKLVARNIAVPGAPTHQESLRHKSRAAPKSIRP